jgi:hypothetical protein
MAQVVECLPSKALNSNWQKTKKTKQKKPLYWNPFEQQMYAN